MFNFFKKQRESVLPTVSEENASIGTETLIVTKTTLLPHNEASNLNEQSHPPELSPKEGFFSKLKKSLTKTRKQLTEGLTSVFLGRKTIDDTLFEELETVLLTADVGLPTTQKIIADLTAEISRKHLKDPTLLFESLKNQLYNLLNPYAKPIEILEKKPFVILMIGVNGAGKTTSIAKLAHHFKQAGKRVLLAAGDTFRAAAVEQLQVWGERNQIPVIAQHNGADSASVIFDGFSAAKARNADILIADTAGRLHTKSHLMEELKKIKRVLAKCDPSAPHETLLVLDAGAGQNAVAQAREFHQAMQVNGLILTKLDGTAKGGVIFSITDQLKLPIRYIGIGEQVEDLKPFDAKVFVEALFGE